MSQAKNQPHGGMGPGPKHGPGGPRHMMGGKPKESRATIKRLLEYMGKDKMLVVLALVFVLVFSGATLAGSYMLKPIVDQLGKTAVQVASLKNKNLDNMINIVKDNDNIELIDYNTQVINEILSDVTDKLLVSIKDIEISNIKHKTTK